MSRLGRVDLNLLVYLDALLRERNVTQAAHSLGLSQPAMSNGLKRLREVFNDPLLIRTSDGMTPTAKAEELEPQLREILTNVDRALQPTEEFVPETENRVVRLMASDYAESTLLPYVLKELREQAPGITLDNYLAADHIWVSKTGMGVGVGVNPDDVQRLGWVDSTLGELGKKRRIRVFTRHYQAAMTLAEQNDLIVTLPTRATQLKRDNPRVVVRDVPFDIPPLELKMAWSPLLQHNPGHRWIRQLITKIARSI